MRKTTLTQQALTGAVSFFAMMIAAGTAVAQTEEVAFDIEEQSLSKALLEFNEQSGLSVAAPIHLVEGKTAPAVKGEMSPEEALEKLLSNSGLKSKPTPSGDAFTVTLASASLGEGSAQTRPFRVASLAQENDEPVAVDSDDQDAEDDDPTREDVVVVTGTRIKGVKDQFSPVTQVSREEMDLAGFANVSDVVESLPQNFGGGVTIDTSAANTSSGPGNSSINLRGLGDQATLILLNGRRLAGGGSRGQFVDISAIPASAIERVDILTDGASAIYGSDAVAGVVNIILRDDFNGAETRINAGTITDGGGDYLKAGQTLGWSGERAHAMVTYEYSVEEELDSNDKDFADRATDPTWLLPFTQKHSVYASTGVEISERLDLSIDGYFNDRKSKQFTSINIPNFSQSFTVTDVQQVGVAIGLDYNLGNEWEANLSGSYSTSEHFTDQIRLSDATGNEDFTDSETLELNGSVSGPLLYISDEAVRGVIGGQFRSESADISAIFTPSQNIAFESDKSRDVYALFGELYAPIISSSNRKPGIERLAFSMAARYEEYSDVGSSFDPKVSLAWSPVSDINLRGTYGTSFRAPRLDELRNEVSSAILGLLVDPSVSSGTSVAFLVFGNQEDLDPEQSRTWTVGFDFTPKAIDGFELRGTYFDTEYDDQVGFPGVLFDSSFRFTDFTGVPVSNPDQGTVTDLCDQAPFCFNFFDIFSLGDSGFEDVEVLLDARTQNLSKSKVSGFDFEGSYEFGNDLGDWRFSLAGTLLTTFEQQVAPAAEIDDLLNTFGNPVDLRLRGGVQWSKDAFTTAVFLNHTGDYADDEVPIGNFDIASFTTVDATFRINLGEISDSRFADNSSLNFSILNVFDEDPPQIGEVPLRNATFDAANSNPSGRRVGVLLTKRW